MIRGATSMALGCALSLGLSANVALANSPKGQANSPNGQAYNVNVFSSFGTQFSDCFAFNDSGTLLVQGYGPLVYRFDELNTQPDAWQATAGTNPPFGFVLAFHGTVGGGAGQTIIANGISSEGDTFILQGVVVPSCAPGRSGASPYAH
jgi:hypothetical protein